MTDTWTLFDGLADRYDQVIPFFAELATQLLDLVEAAPGYPVPGPRQRPRRDRRGGRHPRMRRDRG